MKAAVFVMKSSVETINRIFGNQLCERLIKEFVLPLELTTVA